VVSIAEPFMVNLVEPLVLSGVEGFMVCLNELLNLLTMKKITKTKVNNTSIVSNASIASRQFSVIRH
jgi:hypothetical protein